MAAICRVAGVLLGEGRGQQGAVVRVAVLDERLDPGRKRRLGGAVVAEQAAGAVQDFGGAVDGAFGLQDLQGPVAQFVGDAGAAQVQDGVFDGL